MNTIITLFEHVGLDNLNYQVLRNVSTGTKLKKDLVEISFVTDQVDSDYLINEHNKVGIVVWMPKDKYDAAVAELTGEPK